MKNINLTKLIKQTLHQAFPNTKFSVRAKSYSGGCSIDARWDDGPSYLQVQPILNRFEEGKGFNGMDDSSYYCGKRTYKGEEVNFCVINHAEYYVNGHIHTNVIGKIFVMSDSVD